MKTDSSRHVTLIPDKPAGVNPSFTAANAVTPGTQQAVHVRLDLFHLLSPESFLLFFSPAFYFLFCSVVRLSFNLYPHFYSPFSFTVKHRYRLKKDHHYGAETLSGRISNHFSILIHHYVIKRFSL